MCSINGFNWADSTLIKSMVKKTKHRGPDGQGFYVDDHVSLGHARLSIVDLSKRGKQPMETADGRYVIVYNGELYNFKELRSLLIEKGYRFNSDTDTEVILYAYQEFGPQCLEMFNGMFAFCIYDTLTHSLFLARDRIGIKPLYYFFDGKHFIFASEIKAILEHAVDRSVSKSSLANYLYYGYVPAPQTMFSSIQKLKQGHYLFVKGKKIEEHEYFTLSFSPRKSSVDAHQVYTELRESVDRHRMSDVPFGAYLSGGVDSSSIVALMGSMDAKVTTYSVGFNSTSVIDELKYARIVANHFGTNHHEVVVEASDALKHLSTIAYHLDEPINNPAAIPLYVMSKLAKKNMTVVLTGNGGDELFAGYRQHALISTSYHYYSKAPILVRNPVTTGLLNALHLSLRSQKFKRYTEFSKNFLNVVHKPQLAYELLMYRQFSKKDVSSICQEPPSEILSLFFRLKTPLLNQLLAVDLSLLLPDNFLMVDDKINMANGIESRVPFLDAKFVDFSLSIPPALKVKRLEGKIILKKAMKHLLPREILTRKKYGFTPPVSEWIHDGLRSRAIEVFTDYDFGEILNAHSVVKMLEEKSMRGNNKIFPLLMFGEWWRKFGA